MSKPSFKTDSLPTTFSMKEQFSLKPKGTFKSIIQQPEPIQQYKGENIFTLGTWPLVLLALIGAGISFYQWNKKHTMFAAVGAGVGVGLAIIVMLHK